MIRLVRASWNWWTAAAIVAALVFTIGSQVKVTPNTDIERVALTKKTRVQARSADAAISASGAVAKAAPLQVNAAEQAGGPAPATEARGRIVVRSVLENRQIARKASVSLIVADVEHALAALSALTRTSGGDIVKLDDERPASPNEQHAADATAIVPQERLDSILKQIVRLGDLRSQTISADDVTDQLVDNEARLRNLRRTESDTLKIMDRSGRVGEVLAVENQLSDVRDQIEKLDAETHALAARVATSTIEVHFEDAVTATLAEPSVGTTLGNAWRGAWQGSRDAAVALVARSFYFIAFGPYWLVPLAVIGFAVSRFRRRLVALHL
jgi:hypothetical protein